MATIALQQQQLQLQQESSCQWPHNHTTPNNSNNHNTTMVSLTPNLAINMNNLPTIPTNNRDTTTPSSSPSTYNTNNNNNHPLKRPWNEKDSRDILQLMLSQFDDHQTPAPDPPSSNNNIASHTSLRASTTLDLFGNQETGTNSCADVGLVEEALLAMTKPPPGPPNSLLSSSSDCVLGSSNSKSELMTGGVDPLDDAHHRVPRTAGWEKCLDLKTGEVYFINSASRATTLNDPCETSTLESTKDVSSQHARPMCASSAQQLCLDVNPTLSLASGSTSYPYPSKKNKISSSSTQEANLELNLNLSSFGPLTKVSSHLMKDTLSPYKLDHADTNQYDKDDYNNSMVIVGCPCCLMYVMLLRSEPKCPKCGSHVIDTNCQGNTRYKTKSLGLEL